MGKSRKYYKEVESLKDDSQIVKMHDYACNRFGFARDWESLYRVFAYAEHAIRVGNNPRAMFFHLIKNANYKIPECDWDRAYHRAKVEVEKRKISTDIGNQAVD